VSKKAVRALAVILHKTDFCGCWSLDLYGQRPVTPHAEDFNDARTLLDALLKNKSARAAVVMALQAADHE
jgi:hypothetical protein